MTAQLPTGSFTPPGRFAMIERTDPVTRANNQNKLPVQLLIDVTITEIHDFSAEVTEYPVESGGTISDNIRHKPIIVTIEGIVTNTPLDPMQSHRNPAAVPSPPVFGPQPPQTLGPQPLPALGPERPPESYAESALNFLMGVWRDRETITLRTSIGTFRNMVMENLSVPRSNEVGDALKFNARFKQVTIIDNKRVVAGGGLERRTSGRSTGKKKNLGTRPAIFEEGGSVLWRKGINVDSTGKVHSYLGGSPIVGDSELVYFIRLRRTFETSPGPGNTVKNFDNYETATNGQWFHSDKETALDPEEVNRLKLDLARDKRNGRNPLQTRYERSFDTKERKTKEPVDLNKIDRDDPRFERGGAGGPEGSPKTTRGAVYAPLPR